MNHNVRAAQQFSPAQRQQSGIAGAGADQIYGPICSH
jgi:hypothetical protein